MVRRERSWPRHQLRIVFVRPEFFEFIYNCRDYNDVIANTLDKSETIEKKLLPADGTRDLRELPSSLIFGRCCCSVVP